MRKRSGTESDQLINLVRREASGESRRFSKHDDKGSDRYRSSLIQIFNPRSTRGMIDENTQTSYHQRSQSESFSNRQARSKSRSTRLDDTSPNADLPLDS